MYQKYELLCITSYNVDIQPQWFIKTLFELYGSSIFPVCLSKIALHPLIPCYRTIVLSMKYYSNPRLRLFFVLYTDRQCVSFYGSIDANVEKSAVYNLCYNKNKRL